MQLHQIPYGPPAALAHLANHGVDVAHPLPDALEKRVKESGLGYEKDPAYARMQWVTALNQRQHMLSARAGGMERDAFNVRAVRESTTPSDFDAFTTQALAFTRDVYADFVFPQLVTMRPMLGPRAFVQRMRLKRDQASDFYAANFYLNEGNDPSYTESPGDCTNSNTISMQITNDEIEAEARSLAWDICMPAQWHASSQYGINAQSELDGGLRLELQRATQSDGLSLMVNSAGGTQDYTVDPPAGSYYETADPKLWARVLWDRINQADRNSKTSTESRRPLNLVIGDVEAIGLLSDLISHDLTDSRAGMPSDMGVGSNQLANLYGVTRGGRWRIFEVLEGMPENTLIVTRKDDADPVMIHGQWIPFTNLGTLVDPKARKITGGAISLYGQTVILPDAIQEIRITPAA